MTPEELELQRTALETHAVSLGLDVADAPIEALRAAVEDYSGRLGTEIPHTEPGWVDALCGCGKPASHAGLFCPDRIDPAGVSTPEQEAAAAMAAELDAENHAFEVRKAKAFLANVEKPGSAPTPEEITDEHRAAEDAIQRAYAVRAAQGALALLGGK